MTTTLTAKDIRKNARFRPIFQIIDEALEAIDATQTTQQTQLDAAIVGDLTPIFTGVIPIQAGYESRFLYGYNASNVGVLIKANADEALAESCCIVLGRTGSGTFQIDTATGVTLNGTAGPQTAQITLAAGGVAFLFQTSTDSWRVVGNIV